MQIINHTCSVFSAGWGLSFSCLLHVWPNHTCRSIFSLNSACQGLSVTWSVWGFWSVEFCFTMVLGSNPRSNKDLLPWRRGILIPDWSNFKERKRERERIISLSLDPQAKLLPQAEWLTVSIISLTLTQPIFKSSQVIGGAGWVGSLRRIIRITESLHRLHQVERQWNKKRGQKKRRRKGKREEDRGNIWANRQQTGLNWIIEVEPRGLNRTEVNLKLKRAEPGQAGPKCGDGWIPGVRSREGGRSLRPRDLHQTASDGDEAPVLGEWTLLKLSEV